MLMGLGLVRGRLLLVSEGDGWSGWSGWSEWNGWIWALEFYERVYMDT
jgi:hypothetical protein